MKVLFLTNPTLSCGVAEFGRQNVAALQALGHSVEVWHPLADHHWPSFRPHPNPDPPPDVVHVNYHPGTLDFLAREEGLHLATDLELHWGEGRLPLMSAFLHDPTADFYCGRLDAAFCAEPATAAANPTHDGRLPPEGVDELWMPAPVVELGGILLAWQWPASAAVPTAGTSTLRQDGIDRVAPVLEGWGIRFDHGQHEGGWVETQKEVRRLSRCDFLVYWYLTANPGQSAAVMTGVAAQRPVLINSNRMFDSLREYDDELYRAEDLGEGIREVLADLRYGQARVPRRLLRDRNWRAAAERMAQVWEERRRRS